jgi:spoIIIJ-associated protein
MAWDAILPVMPIDDYTAAAQTIAQFLKLLTSAGGLKLRYRITAGPGAADPDGFEAREIYVELAGPDAGLLTGRNGELLRALEHVAAKMIHLEADEHDRLSFDAENFKAQRAREWKRQAWAAVERVRATGAPFAFAPMSSHERRMLHIAFRVYADVETGSVGEGLARALVVFPRGYDRVGYERSLNLPAERQSFRESRRR